MSFRASATSRAVEHNCEALGCIDHGMQCLRCGDTRAACRCFAAARREVRAANELLDRQTTKAA